MKINSSALIEDLIQRTQYILHEAEQFRKEAIDTLNWKASAKQWSILECLRTSQPLR